MKMFFTLSAVLICAVACGQNRSQKRLMDEKYGFRNLRFETPLSEFNNMILMEGDSTKGFYDMKNENLQLGEAHLDSISYSFYENKLATIMIFTSGYSNSRAVLDVLKNAYGAGVKDNPYIQTYFWNSKLVSIVYKENSVTNNAVTIIFSEPMRKEQENMRQKKNEAAAQNAF